MRRRRRRSVRCSRCGGRSLRGPSKDGRTVTQVRDAALVSAAVVEAFGDHADQLVFVGAAVLSLYVRPSGAPVRATKDVDCIWTLSPWALQEQRLGKMFQAGVLVPVKEVLCRYRIAAVDVDVDVLSLDGHGVCSDNPWLSRAVDDEAERERIVDEISHLARRARQEPGAGRR